MATNSSSVLKNTTLSLAIGWTFLILVLCLVKFNKLPAVQVSGADKYVHFTFHFTFTLLWGFYNRLRLGQWVLKSSLIIVCLSIVYGILIEILQETLTKTRKADVMDVAANAAGAITALLVIVLLKLKSKA
jgi:VanZ family protein